MLSLLSYAISMPGLQIIVRIGNYFSNISIKTYVVGNQKNNLDERVFLNTQNTFLNGWIKKYI